MPKPKLSRTGSIYALTLLTVAAVGSMVLIGAALRNATSNRSTIVQSMSSNASGVMDASELVLAKILSDPKWATNAQSGEVFSPLTLGNRTYESAILDAVTDALPTDSTTTYKITITSKSGIAQESASFEIERIKFDYYAYLESIGLDAYWPLNDPPMSSVALEPKDGRNGTYLNPAIAGAGTNEDNGIVPVFAGTADHIQTPYVYKYQNDIQGTVTFWMKLTGTSPVTPYGIFGQRFVTNGMPSVTMNVLAGSITAFMDDAGAFSYNNTATTLPNRIKVGKWHHIAMSWGPAGFRIYIDGVLEASKPITDYWNTHAGISGKQPLVIGAGYIASPVTQPLVGFVGSISHFGIMVDQLDAATIAEIASIKPDASRLQLVDGSWVKVYQ